LGFSLSQRKDNNHFEPQLQLLSHFIVSVTTLVLGSQPKQRLAKVQTENETWESHFMLPRGYEGMNPHTPKWAPTLGVGNPILGIGVRE
jgi:hypothetical protein